MRKYPQLLIPILFALTLSTLSQTPTPVATADLSAIKRKLLNIDNAVLEKSAIKKVQPKAPPGVKTSGVVHVQVEIELLGKVAKAKAISGPKTLRNVAVETAKQWKFKPIDDVNPDFRYGGILHFDFSKK